jgi:type II secretory pathway component PulK
MSLVIRQSADELLRDLRPYVELLSSINLNILTIYFCYKKR